MKSFRTLWPYILRHRYRVAAGLLALLVCDFCQLVIPRVVKFAVDELSSLTADAASLAWAGILILLMASTIGLFRYFWRQLILGFSRIVEEDIRNRLYRKLLILSPSWFNARTTGDVMAHATNDLEAVRMAGGMGMVALVDAIVMGAASIVFMVYIDLNLTLLALIPMPLVTIMTRILSNLMYKRYRRVQDIFGRMTEQVREFLDGIRVIKAHVREKLVIGDLDRTGRDYVRENIRLNFVSGAFFPLMLMFTNLSLAIVLYFGGRLTISTVISPGDFVAFISYLNLLTWPMMALGWVTNLIQRGAAGFDRINQVLGQEQDVTDPLNPIRPDHFDGNIDIRELTFQYPERNEDVFKDLTLTFPAGRITGLVGRTGSGKSTLINLLLRLYNPPSNTIFLDGMPIERLLVSDLRGAIGYVPQDGYVFFGTFAENIAFGKISATKAEIMDAARAADLEEDILSFPNGLDTFIGERGVTLSGGQKQRLALARALIMDPPVLLLDDTLSAVDSAAEEKILHNLLKLRSGRTTIIVAHRLSSLKIANLIHVIENGKLSESGRHEELLAMDGYYARMHRLQAALSESGPMSSEHGKTLEAGHVG